MSFILLDMKHEGWSATIGTQKESNHDNIVNTDQTTIRHI